MTLRYNTTDRYLYHVCHQNVSGAPLHDMLNVGYNVAKERGIQKWLSDDRKNPELSQEDITFGVQDWGPRMAAIGWKYWALVVPETMAGRASMQQIIEVWVYGWQFSRIPSKRMNGWSAAKRSSGY